MYQETCNLVIGSGPSGACAALRLAQRGEPVVVLDVGLEPNDSNLKSSLYSSQTDLKKILIGDDFEVLEDLFIESQAPVKIKSPAFNYLTKLSDELSPIEPSSSYLAQSFSKGGLANAWGAGLYRFSEDELSRNGMNSSQLKPYYDFLTEKIGISGANDDLVSYFGESNGILPPLSLSRNFQDVLKKYYLKKSSLNNEGFFLGRPRLGIRSIGYNYDNLEFWNPNNAQIFSPREIIDDLVNSKKINYFSNIYVSSISSEDNELIVKAHTVKSKKERVFKAKRVFLGAGTLGTSKIILNSFKDYSSKLKLKDNGAAILPLINFRRFSHPLELDSFGLTQLNLVFKSDKTLVQGSLIELTSPSRSSLIDYFPFSYDVNLSFLRELVPSISALQLFFPDSYSSSARISLNPRGSLEVSRVRNESHPYRIVKDLQKKLFSLGFISPDFLTKWLPFGAGIHYAGTFDNSKENSFYSLTDQGDFQKLRNVFPIDGSVLSYLPAKNYSFTLMANSMRIVDLALKKSFKIDTPSKLQQSNKKEKTVLITGASGFVGKNLSALLKKQGFWIIGQVRKPLKRAYLDKSLVLEFGDFFLEKDLEGVDLVVHLAHDFSKSEKFNIDSTKRWEKQFRQTGVPQIFCSSLSSTQDSSSEYGRIKHDLENYFLKRRHYIIRPGLITGAKGGIFYKFAQVAKDKKLLPMINGGKHLVYITPISSIASFIRKVSSSSVELREVNLAQEVPVRMVDLIKGYAPDVKILNIPYSLVYLITWIVEHIIGRGRLPISKDNLIGLKKNQYSVYPSHLNFLNIDELTVDKVIKELDDLSSLLE